MHSSEATFKYHERPVSRARTLYRIPTAPNNKRTLELSHSNVPLLTGFTWPTESVVCWLGSIPTSIASEKVASNADVQHMNYLDPLPFAAGSFDLVILHRTLDDLATSARQSRVRFDAPALVNNIARVLAPGGLIAGCVDNRASIKLLTRWARGIVSGEGLGASMGHFTLRSLSKLLTHAGFNEIRQFTLLPSCQNPLRLIDIDPVVSKVAFRREIESARDAYSSAAHLGRRVAVELGLYPHLEESIFFWAYKRC